MMLTFLFNETPLFTAVKCERIDIIKFLLSNPQIDVNKTNIDLFIFESDFNLKI